jgi:hypothetical protein
MLPCMIDAPHPKSAARLARERRLHVLRVRIAAFAVAIFVAVWAGLFVQLVSGDDPALAGDLESVATQSTDPAVASDDGWSTASSSGPAAVTTGQS